MANEIPSDFGAHHGTTISNKSSVLSDVDKCLGRKKPPAIEYIFVAPFSRWTSKWFPWVSFAGNYYGQYIYDLFFIIRIILLSVIIIIILLFSYTNSSAVKYLHPDTKESIVMNISGELSGNV
jgi:hypothetical protein